MAMTVYSNSGTEQDLKDAAVAAGFEPEEKAVPEDKAGSKPEQDQPGDKSAAEKPVKAAPDSDPEDNAQPGETQDDKEHEEKRKSKGGFQKKLERLTAELDEERGDKAELKKQIRELNAKIEALQTPAEPAVEADKGPVKPKRPKTVGSLESFGWDQTQYDAAVAAHETAMDKYETDLEEFHRKIAAETASAEIQKRDTAAAERQREAAYVRMQNAFVDRLNEGKQDIPDYQEMVEACEGIRSIFDPTEKDTKGEFIPAHARVYIEEKCKNPAALIYHFAKDLVEGGGTDNNRLMEMDPIDLISELSWMDRQLTQQKAAAKDGGEKPKPSAAAEPEKKTPPVAERQTPPPVRATPAPRERLGTGGTPAVAGNLDEQMKAAAEAKNGPLFRKLLAQQQEQNAKRRAAG